MKYKIIEVNEVEHSIVVRYFTDKITEVDLAVQIGDGGIILRCRTDYSIDLPIPAPTGDDLDEFILQRAPTGWFAIKEAVADPSVDTSLEGLKALIGVTKRAKPFVERLEAKLFNFAPVRVGEVLIRMATQKDVQEMAALAVASKLYPDASVATRDLLRLVNDPAGWFLVYEWNGNLIQYESLTFDGETARMGWTEHVSKERSNWFWRVIEQPTFDALAAVGIKKIVAHVAIAAVEYFESLTRVYNSTSTGVTPDGKYRWHEFDLLPQAQTPVVWPDRRTLGSGWEWLSADGTIRVSEAVDLGAARKLCQEAWKGSSRTADILRMFDERVGLDRATVLIGESATGDTAVEPMVYVVRQRSDDTSSFSCLMPWTGAAYEGRIAQGVMAWHQLVGYKTATTWGQQRLDHPLFQQHITRIGGAITGVRNYRNEVYQVMEVDLAASLLRPEGAWIV